MIKVPLSVWTKRSRAVRRIYVTGHADMVGSYEINHKLSAERAESVVQYMFTILRCLDGHTGLDNRKGFDHLEYPFWTNPLSYWPMLKRDSGVLVQERPFIARQVKC